MLFGFVCVARGHVQKFYRYHEMLNEKEAERQLRVSGGPPGRPPFWAIFKQASPQLFNIFFVFFVTLSIFPTVHSSIKPSDPDFIIGAGQYVSVLCFLTFNLCAMLGSAGASVVQWPRKERLVWPVVLRVLFVPLFLLCNYMPKDTVRHMPIYIDNDWAYWGLAVAMGLSSGYFR